MRNPLFEFDRLDDDGEIFSGEPLDDLPQVQDRRSVIRERWGHTRATREPQEEGARTAIPMPRIRGLSGYRRIFTLRTFYEMLHGRASGTNGRAVVVGAVPLFAIAFRMAPEEAVRVLGLLTEAKAVEDLDGWRTIHLLGTPKENAPIRVAVSWNGNRAAPLGSLKARPHHKPIGNQTAAAAQPLADPFVMLKQAFATISRDLDLLERQRPAAVAVVCSGRNRLAAFTAQAEHARWIPDALRVLLREVQGLQAQLFLELRR